MEDANLKRRRLRDDRGTLSTTSVRASGQLSIRGFANGALRNRLGVLGVLVTGTVMMSFVSVSGIMQLTIVAKTMIMSQADPFLTCE